MSAPHLRLVEAPEPVDEPAPFCHWPPSRMSGAIIRRRTRTDKVTRAELTHAVRLVNETLLRDTEPVSGRLPERHVLTLCYHLHHIIRRLDLHIKK